jgi:hypothetical protein
MHIHHHKVVAHPHGTGHFTTYGQCRCGHRRYWRAVANGHQPIDLQWVRTGEWAKAPTEAPPKPWSAQWLKDITNNE